MPVSFLLKQLKLKRKPRLEVVSFDSLDQWAEVLSSRVYFFQHCLVCMVQANCYTAYLVNSISEKSSC